MFTGLIAEVGRVKRLERMGSQALLAVECFSILEDASPGDSIAVDGACVTVEEMTSEGFSAFLSEETLARTTLSSLESGGGVNLEAAIRPTDRLGGHLVQGHVEGVGRVKSLTAQGRGGGLLSLELPGDLVPYVVGKGSIALAGISLTVSSIENQVVSVWVVPATLENTTMGGWRPGRRVNVETDLIGRYIVDYLRSLHLPKEGVTQEDLERRGF